MLNKLYLLHCLLEETNLSKDDVFVFGGTVRDRLLSRQPEDIDLVIVNQNKPDDFLKNLKRNFKVVMEKEEFSFVKVVFKGAGNLVVDFQFSKTLLEFLQSRDFTVNSLAVPFGRILSFFCVPEKDLLIDPNSGFKDLERRRIELCSEEAFAKDPVRILRASYYAAKLNFVISPSLVAIAKNSLCLLRNLKKEKVRENVLQMSFEQPFLFFKGLRSLEADVALTGKKIDAGDLVRIKTLESILKTRNLSQKEKTVVKVAILQVAGFLETETFEGAFSRSNIKKAGRLLKMI